MHRKEKNIRTEMLFMKHNVAGRICLSKEISKTTILRTAHFVEVP